MDRRVHAFISSVGRRDTDVFAWHWLIFIRADSHDLDDDAERDDLLHH
jgi:hypothetical protein